MIVKNLDNYNISFFNKANILQQINEDVILYDISSNINDIKYKNKKSLIITIAQEINSCTQKEKVEIIKKIKILKKLCKKNRIQFGELINGKVIILNLEENFPNDSVIENEIIIALNAILYKNKEKRLTYLYKMICKYLDRQFIENNLCDFKDDICIAKRNTNTTMGCCHYHKHKYIGILLPNDFVLCRYQKNRTCQANCITCKLFTCNTLQEKQIKFTTKNVILIDLFFNPIQKLIIKCSYFTDEKKILKRLLFVDFRR